MKSTARGLTGFITVAVVALFICGLRSAEANSVSAAYRVVWQDQFNGSMVDTSKWAVESSGADGHHTCCLGDGLQQWTPSAVTLKNGQMSLLSQRTANGGYTSGAVTTFGTYSFTYGRVDIRAQMPTGAGLWSAFWMLPVSGYSNGYAANEIDVLETLGQDTYTAYYTEHWNSGKQQTQCTASALPDLSASFHTYSMIWTSTSVTWLLDGVQRCKTTQGVPQQPMYLIMNTYVGGTWPVAPSASTPLPQSMKIDYVRVSQTTGN